MSGARYFQRVPESGAVECGAAAQLVELVGARWPVIVFRNLDATATNEAVVKIGANEAVLATAAGTIADYDGQLVIHGGETREIRLEIIKFFSAVARVGTPLLEWWTKAD